MAPPIGTPGCTGGGTARIGALYTGLGPVCGTIIRGAGGGRAAGRAGVEDDAAGEDAEIEGGATAEGICAVGGGVTVRAGGALTGVDAAGGATTGRAATTGGAGGAATAAGGGAVAGLLTGGAMVAGRLTPAGGAAAGFSAAGGVTGGAAARGGA